MNYGKVSMNTKETSTLKYFSVFHLKQTQFLQM